MTESTFRTAKALLPDHGTLKTWHRLLFKDVVPTGYSYYAGNFRGTDPRYPCLNGIAHVGGAFGVLPQAVEETMRTWASDLRVQETQLTRYIRIEKDTARQTMAKISFVAGSVGTFIRIHPFRNGNGRISRILANHLCYRHDLPMPFADPSSRPPLKDYAESGAAAMRGDLRPTFLYLLAAVQARANA